jgi:adenylylsulfate kinase
MCNSLNYNELSIFQKTSFSIWLTGLSGSGKTTLANTLSGLFNEKGIKMMILDGDNLRKGVNNNLGFSIVDRKENIRRAAEISKLYNDFGITTINAFICPTNELRKMASNIVGEDKYIEIFLDAPLAICENRDPKGLYAKCRKGEIAEFTGINSPFEIPENPNFTIKTDKESPEVSAKRIFELILVYICTIKR